MNTITVHNKRRDRERERGGWTSKRQREKAPSTNLLVRGAEQFVDHDAMTDQLQPSVGKARHTLRPNRVEDVAAGQIRKNISIR